MFNQLSLKNKFIYVTQGKAKAYGQQLLDLISMDIKDANIQAELNLIKRGADLTVINERGQGVLSMAIIREKFMAKTTVIETLLEYGAPIGVCSKTGATPFHYAIIKDDPDLMSVFLNRGTDMNRKDKKGRTPLVVSQVFNAPKAESFLIYEKKKEIVARKKDICDAIDNGTKTAIPRKHFGGFKNQR